MSNNDKQPDWWARCFGIVGILTASVGLTFTFINNRWQKQVYEKSQEERIFVQVSAGLVSRLDKQKIKISPQGKLGVEIVNFGAQPMYIRSVDARIGNETAVLYQHDSLKPEQSLPRLDPGQSVSYATDWTFADREIALADLQQSPTATVNVETTKKKFAQPAKVNNITINSIIPLLENLTTTDSVAAKKN